MAFVSAAAAASAALSLSVPSAARGGSGAFSCPQLRRPLSVLLHAAKGPNSAPMGLESKVKSKKKKSGAGNLTGALDIEIKEAQEYLDSDEQEPVPENFPFEITDEAGMSVVILKRDYKDEKVEVIVSMPNLEGGPEFDDEDGEGDSESASKDDEEAEDDDESAGDSSISLKVVVSKDSGPKLEFTCTAFREEITIDDMLIVEKADDDGEEKFPYEGPEFTELPVNVQKGLFKYLEQRGITLSATNYMHDYMVTKQAQEYIRWMTKLKDFVRQ